jgi:hypothetical protein
MRGSVKIGRRQRESLEDSKNVGAVVLRIEFRIASKRKLYYVIPVLDCDTDDPTDVFGRTNAR